MKNRDVTSAAAARLTLNNYLLPALIGVLLILQFVSPYRGWVVLLVGLGGALLVSYLWARSLRDGLHLHRARRFGWTRVGDQMVERFTLDNDGWAPALWVEIVDHSDMPDYRASRVSSVDGRRSIRWHTTAVCTLRGLFTLGPTSLRTGDPFGLFTVTHHYPASTPLLVTPPIVPLPTIDVAPGGRAGAGRPRVNAPERTVSVSGVREYAAGDSQRWIHWPTSARRDELFVRVFDNTPAGDWWIVLDVDRRVQVGQGLDATDEHGVILAASLADRGLRARRAVGLAAHGDHLVWLPPQVGDGRRWDILYALALISPGELPLAELLTRTGPALGGRDSLVIITPAVDGGWIEPLMPLLRRGCIPTVLLLDQITFGGVGDVAGVAALLTDLGVAHDVIARDLLDGSGVVHPESRPLWEWRILGTGRAVPIRRPEAVPWRTLS